MKLDKALSKAKKFNLLNQRKFPNVTFEVREEDGDYKVIQLYKGRFVGIALY